MMHIPSQGRKLYSSEGADRIGLSHSVDILDDGILFGINLFFRTWGIGGS